MKRQATPTLGKDVMGGCCTLLQCLVAIFLLYCEVKAVDHLHTNEAWEFDKACRTRLILIKHVWCADEEDENVMANNSPAISWLCLVLLVVQGACWRCAVLVLPHVCG
jgi:hypothetical protein